MCEGDILSGDEGGLLGGTILFGELLDDGFPLNNTETGLSAPVLLKKEAFCKLASHFEAAH